MSLYNYNRVKDFLQTNKSYLLKLKKFQSLVHSPNFEHDVIELIKLKEKDLVFLLQLFETRKIDSETMFVSSLAETNHANKLIRSVSEFPEFFENINDHHFKKKGTQYFVSCFDTGTKERNLGQKFNISLSSTFLGEYDDDLGRLLIYRNKVPLNFLYIGDHNFQGRRLLSHILSKLILGSDYNLSYIQDGFNGPSTRCTGCNNVKGCNADCMCGIWNGYGTLPEYLINYLFEIYCYDKTNSHQTPLFHGIIAMDSNFDKILNIEFVGTEFKIFVPEFYMVLESILYMGNIYYNSTEYYNKIFFDRENYIKNASKVKKNWSIDDMTKLNNNLDKYCKLRYYGPEHTNVFNQHSVLKPKNMTISGGGDNKYVRYISKN